LFIAGPSLLGNRIVRDALVANPEMLIEAGNSLRERQFAESLKPIRASIERPYYSSWKGAEKPDVTMTYFFDYACGYCRQSNPDIERLVKEDKGLRVVYRELPILGPESVAAARVSLSASKAGKFGAYHDALYAAGRPSQQTITLAAKAAGVPAAPMDNAEQEAELKANMAFASQLGATGTPLFVIGDRVINAAVGYDALKEAVTAARSKS
jgi:protein-disulfide isomerase